MQRERHPFVGSSVLLFLVLLCTFLADSVEGSDEGSCCSDALTRDAVDQPGGISEAASCLSRDDTTEITELVAAERVVVGKLRAKQIKRELERRGVSFKGLVDKEDLVAALATARIVSNRTFTERMVKVPGGAFVMGTNVSPPYPGDGEGPPRLVVLSDFFLDEAEVSNNQFAEFVAATGYVTESETYGWSFVFELALRPETKAAITQAVQGAEWWLPVQGATWRSPEGPGSSVFAQEQAPTSPPPPGSDAVVTEAGEGVRDAPAGPADFPGGRGMHPVVHVSWSDAKAYCAWRNGSRLPTEAEWEYAAQYMSDPMARKTLFPWGEDLTDAGGNHRMNIWQGDFPTSNDGADGWRFTSPSDAMEPQNELGLKNMLGNVWEWVEDWWTVDHRQRPLQTTEVSVVTDSSTMAMTNRTAALDPSGPLDGTEKTKKGGSYLCHKSFCYRYRAVARHKNTPDSATSNNGFRCSRSAAVS